MELKDLVKYYVPMRMEGSSPPNWEVVFGYDISKFKGYNVDEVRVALNLTQLWLSQGPRVMVPMVHTPPGRSGATFVKALAQSECGQFYHFGICGPNWDRHHAEWHGDLREPRAWESLLDSRWIAYGMADPISKQAWRYTIGSTPNFG